MIDVLVGVVSDAAADSIHRQVEEVYHHREGNRFSHQDNWWLWLLICICDDECYCTAFKKRGVGCGVSQSPPQSHTTGTEYLCGVAHPTLFFSNYRRGAFSTHFSTGVPFPRIDHSSHTKDTFNRCLLHTLNPHTSDNNRPRSCVEMVFPFVVTCNRFIFLFLFFILQ